MDCCSDRFRWVIKKKKNNRFLTPYIHFTKLEYHKYDRICVAADLDFNAFYTVAESVA